MVWTANSLAKKLGCAWVTIKRAIVKGELKATWDEDRRVWLIEDGRERAFFVARLAYLQRIRQARAERMRSLWQQGKLRPRRRRQEQVVERLVRPRFVIIGEGAFARTASIRWEGDEGAFACPTCATLLRLKG